MDKYTTAARKYQPTSIKILFVAESPPAGDERYFYFADVAMGDSLWVNLMRAIYHGQFGETKQERSRKRQWLERFQGDGFFLIDALQRPVERGASEAERARRIKAREQEIIEEICGLNPTHVVMIKTAVYEQLGPAARRAGLPLVNDRPLPFPGSGQQRRFQETFARFVAEARLPL